MESRRTKHICVAVLAALAVLLPPVMCRPQYARAAQSQYGNVIYSAPAGWTRLDQTGAILFVAPASKSGAAVLGILRGRTFTGNFRAWFDAAIKVSLSAGERFVDRTSDTATRGDKTYDVLYTLAVVQDKTGGRSYHFYLAAHPGNRVEMIVYFATSKDAFEANQGALTAFVASLHFANITTLQPQPAPGPAPSPTPGPEPGSSSGTGGVAIYFGEKAGFVFVPGIASLGGGNYEYQIRKIYYVFLPGSRVYNGLPAADNLAHACDARGAGRCGSYAEDGQSVRISWDDGTSQALVRDGAGTLRLGTVVLSRMIPAMDGMRLDGTFAFSTYVDSSGVEGTGSVSGDHTVDFRGNGTFTLTDFVGSVVSGGGTGGTTSSRTTGSGTYRLDGYTVQFSFANGTSARHIFFIVPSQGSTDAIAIDGAIYLKRG